VSKLAAVRIHPIKSCSGIAVDSARVGRRGLDGDRRYMLVDAGGRFLSQREHPEMARIAVEQAHSGLRVTAPGMPVLTLPDVLNSTTDVEVSIWRDRVDAGLGDDSAHAWFSEALALPCRLVYMDDRHRRPVSPTHGQPGDEVSFADGAPILLTTVESLEALNQELPAPITMDRFRPNLVIEGAGPFAEDGWKRIRIGTVELEIAWPCARCILTTVDPTTGIRDEAGEPLATLRRVRSSPIGPLFGQNVIPRTFGVVRVGDSVEVMR